MAPHVHSIPSTTAESISASPPASSSLENIRQDHPSYIDVSTSTSHLRSSEQRPSPGSLKSVDSVPVTGVFPLGTLHLNEPKDGEEDVAVPDRNMATPITLPIPNREPPQVPGPVLELLRNGDVLILDDLPTGFTVGCDTISFAATEHFLGFRDIPAGSHLIWISPSENTSSRSAYWIFTSEKDPQSPGRVYVKQWDRFNEVLSDPASHAEERFQKERLEDGIGNLMPYQFKSGSSTDSAAAPQPTASSLAQVANDPETPPAFVLDSNTIWYQLTFAITPSLLNRLMVGTGADAKDKTWPVNTSDRVAGGTSTVEEARLYANSTSQLKFTFGMEDLLFDTKAEGAERTQQALDPTSWILSELRRSSPESESKTESEGEGSSALNDLVGELQFSFLTGMHLGNYACLEQWWHYTTSVIFRSYRLVVEEPQLARDLIQTVHAQLAYNDRNLEGSIMDTTPNGSSGGEAKKLRKALTVYKSRLNEQLLALGEECTSAQKAVGASFAALEGFLWTWGWDLRGEYLRSGTVMLEDGEVVHAELSDFEDEDERGEFAATVVDVDKSGRPKDLVSV